MNLMNEDNIISIFLNTAGDIILANLLFIACSLPVITIGPSFTALYHCMLRTVKGNRAGTVKTFLKAFRENFVQSLVVWLGILVTIIILSLNIRFLQHMPAAAFGIVLLYLSYGMCVLAAIFFLYIFPVIAAFRGTIRNHFRNAILFAFMHFPSTVLIALISLLPMFMTVQDLQLAPLYVFCWASFGFGLTAYINSTMFYRMFRPYLAAAAAQPAEKP